jgi:hypothetical protein
MIAVDIILQSGTFGTVKIAAAEKIRHAEGLSIPHITIDRCDVLQPPAFLAAGFF